MDTFIFPQLDNNDENDIIQKKNRFLNNTCSCYCFCIFVIILILTLCCYYVYNNWSSMTFVYLPTNDNSLRWFGNNGLGLTRVDV